MNGSDIIIPSVFSQAPCLLPPHGTLLSAAVVCLCPGGRSRVSEVASHAYHCSMCLSICSAFCYLTHVISISFYRVQRFLPIRHKFSSDAAILIVHGCLVLLGYASPAWNISYLHNYFFQLWTFNTNQLVFSCKRYSQHYSVKKIVCAVLTDKWESLSVNIPSFLMLV